MKSIFSEAIKTPFGDVRFYRHAIVSFPFALFFPASFIILLDMDGFSGIVSALLMSMATYLVVSFYKNDPHSRLLKWYITGFDTITKLYIYIHVIVLYLSVYTRSTFLILLYLSLFFVYLIYIGYINYFLQRALRKEEVDFSAFNDEPAPTEKFNYTFLLLLVVSIWVIGWRFDFKAIPFDTSQKYVNIKISPPTINSIEADANSSVRKIEILDDIIHFCSNGDQSACAYAGTIYINSQEPALYTKAYLMLQYSCSEGNAQGCENLAVIYTLGLGREQNLTKAKELYSYACSSGEQNSCNNLIRIDKTMNSIDPQK